MDTLNCMRGKLEEGKNLIIVHFTIILCLIVERRKIIVAFEVKIEFVNVTTRSSAVLPASMRCDVCL